ncbi:hypothetical protein [Sphingobium sp.]|uniref:hypothetical protein n=1 Tax=Sphingobium sp. TaxID=1912891 RepID=UPI003BB49B1F
MARRAGTPIPPTQRRTLCQWIEADDGDTPSFTRPACSAASRTLHAKIALPPDSGPGEVREPLQPPSALRLPPLG